MATVETHTERRPPAEAAYDGFISYSHSADDLLAPRLQAGLQRFAKPWWKRRALRIFRDEASLSANPHLWSSIVEAMETSDWFVLLLSPDAAESEWVNREVEYWLEHKDPSRIIPVVTDGEFEWLGADIDPTTNSAPPALYGSFTDEPRWVDLRFARTEEQLDLNNASFRAAVADIASAIRGVPKDELESEEVRQHKRTRRTATAAGVALLIFAIFAVGAAIYANGQRITAEANEAEADSQRQIAQEQTAVAQEQTAVAEEQTAFAEQLALEARANALAANSIAQLDTKPELALLLAVESLALEDRPAATTAMHQALQRHRTMFELQAPASAGLQARGATGDLSPDGDRIVIAGHSETVELWEVGGDQAVWTWETPIEDSVLFSPRFTADGASIVVVATPAAAFDPTLGARDEVIGEITIDRLFVLDAATGEMHRSIDIPPCPWIMDSTPLPPHVDITRPIAWATCTGASLFRASVGLLDPLDGSFTPLGSVLVSGNGVPSTDGQSRRFAAASLGPGRVMDTATGEVIFEYEGGLSTLSADGSRLLGDGALIDLQTGEELWRTGRAETRGWFSADQQLVYVIGRDDAAVVFDAETGEEIFELRGHEGGLRETSMSSDNRRLATFSISGTGRVWDLSPMRSEGATYVVNSEPRKRAFGSSDLAGELVAVWGGDPQKEDDELWETTVTDLATGDVILTVTGGAPALSPDGARLAYRSVDMAEAGPVVGPVRIVDVRTGNLVLEIPVPCEQQLVGDAVEALPGCPIAGGFPNWSLEYSPDGSLLGMADGHDVAVVFDARTGETLFRQSSPETNPFAIAFTLDQQQVVVTDAASRLAVYNIGSSGLVRLISAGGFSFVFLDMVITPDGSLLMASDSNGGIAIVETETWNQIDTIAAHRGPAIDLAISPDGSRFASAGEDAFVRVWDVTSRSLVTEIEFDVDEIAAVEFIDDSHLFVTPIFGAEAIVITLDADELLNVAQGRLTRSFTPAECETYSIDPCPPA